MHGILVLFTYVYNRLKKRKTETMNKKEIELAVREIMIDKMFIEEEIENHSSFRNHFAMDSLDMIEFTMCCEKKFNISISDEKSEGIDNIEQLVNEIHTLIS